MTWRVIEDQRAAGSWWVHHNNGGPPMTTTSPSTPTITGISHIDLTVTDLDQSERFYADLLGATRVLDGRNDDHHFASRYLLHAETLLIIGLVLHDQAAATGFDPRSVGLDHLAFNVADRAELDAWQQRLQELNIEFTPIVEQDMWDVLVLQDPDGIALEFFYMKPAAVTLLA